MNANAPTMENEGAADGTPGCGEMEHRRATMEHQGVTKGHAVRATEHEDAMEHAGAVVEDQGMGGTPRKVKECQPWRKKMEPQTRTIVHSSPSITLNLQQRTLLNRLVKIVISAIYEVANALGAGFLEKVYERALVVELQMRGLDARPRAPIRVWYKGRMVGDYYADILINDSLIVELKCVDCLGNEHLAQTLNYLKATDRRIALLVNFQHPKVEWRRIVRNF